MRDFVLLPRKIFNLYFNHITENKGKVTGLLNEASISKNKSAKRKKDHKAEKATRRHK